MSGVQWIAVADHESNIRLDRWFYRHYPELKHGRLEKLLRTGQIRLNSARAKASTRVRTGQKIRIPPSVAALINDTKQPVSVNTNDIVDLLNLVIYKDDHVIALNKPPGLAVQGGSRINRHIDGMLDGLRLDAAERPRLVHRLDKDTSGVLLLGRSANSAARLASAFRDKKAIKTYWALTVGVPNPAEGRIDLSVAKRLTNLGERVVSDAVSGKRAITKYAVMAQAGQKIAWITLKPQTGRTHQLRVHCAALGVPIIGDRKYGGMASIIDGLPFTSMMLHARAIELPHPVGGRLAIEAPLHDGMRSACQYLGFETESVT